MKLNLDTVLNTIEGIPRKNIAPVLNEFGQQIRGSNGEIKFEVKGELTLKALLYSAVNCVYTGEEHLPPIEVYKRGKLARKIYLGGEKHFVNDDLTLMSALIVKRYANDPELVISIEELLNPDSMKEEEGE